MDNNLIHKLSEDQEDLVLTSVGYTREQLKADLKQIREWLEEQHHLPECRKKESDAFLEWYLTGCKGSLETVKKKLDNYYTSRNYSEILENRDPLSPDYLTVRHLIKVAIIPHAGYNGERLVIMKVEGDPDKFDYLNYSRILMNTSDIIARLAGIHSGIYSINDCRSIPASLALKIKPSVAKDLLILWKEAVAHRFIKISFIYSPAFIEAIVNNLFKPFLPKKLQDRFHFTTGGYEDLFNYFSPRILPSDFGGDSTNPTFKHYSDLWMKYEQDNRDWFLNELTERTDESKRIITDNTPKNPYFGVHGSLKKLVID